MEGGYLKARIEEWVGDANGFVGGAVAEYQCSRRQAFAAVSIDVGNGMKLNKLKEKGSKSTGYFAFFSIEEAKLHYKHCSLLYL